MAIEDCELDFSAIKNVLSSDTNREPSSNASSVRKASCLLVHLTDGDPARIQKWQDRKSLYSGRTG
jgi:hypothetical protein